METLDAIFKRKSVREFLDKEISDEDMHTILKAGMSGPSCANKKDWKFIVTKDQDLMNKMADANGRPATPLRNAKLAIMVCGDLNKAFPMAKDYWIIDGSIACQNMILAAFDLGIGSVWLGTYPQDDRVKKQKELLNLDDHLVCHSIIAFGYPKDNEFAYRDQFDQTCVEYR